MRHLNFWGFVAERQAIWDSKDKGLPEPYSNDQVLTSRRFTNMYRMLDRGTRFVIANVQEPSTLKEWAIFRNIVYRYFNKEETWNAIEGPLMISDFVAISKILDSLETPFGNAYIQSGQGGNRGYFSFGDRFSLGVLKEISDAIPDLCALTESESPKPFRKKLQQITGIGNFLSWQIAADMCYPLLCQNGSSIAQFNLDDHVHLGPGAIKGLKQLGMTVGNSSLDDLYSMQFEHLPTYGMKWLQPNRNSVSTLPLSKTDLEHALCEYQKYIRVSNGGGNMRKFISRAHTCPTLPRISPYWDYMEDPEKNKPIWMT